jgi:hypothetical protein
VNYERKSQHEYSPVNYNLKEVKFKTMLLLKSCRNANRSLVERNINTKSSLSYLCMRRHDQYLSFAVMEERNQCCAARATSWSGNFLCEVMLFYFFVHKPFSLTHLISATWFIRTFITQLFLLQIFSSTQNQKCSPWYDPYYIVNPGVLYTQSSLYSS